MIRTVVLQPHAANKKAEVPRQASRLLMGLSQPSDLQQLEVHQNIGDSTCVTPQILSNARITPLRQGSVEFPQRRKDPSGLEVRV